MKITEEKLIEFFPRDMRFAYFVANKYNYKFKNGFVMEQANHLAMEAVMKMYREEKEFENEAQMVGYVMNSFRFAMLRMFSDTNPQNRLKLYLESDVTYGDDGDEYSVFQNTASVEPEEIDDNASLKVQLLKDSLTDRELEIFELRYEKGMKYVDIKEQIGIANGSLEWVKSKIKRKYKLIDKKVEENGSEEANAAKENARKESIERANRQAYLELRRKAQRERIEEEKRQKHRRAEALSWLDLDA